jgi:hypothetical protein
VLRLAETVPEKQNYKLVFDNYFTGIDLLKELKRRGILSLGTIKANRLQGCVLKTEKELGYRGAIDSKVSKQGDVCVVRWLDNGVVTLASTLAGVEPQDKVKRWSNSAKEHIDVDRPRAVQLYNNFMGGVDKIDFLISLYRIRAKTRKWPVRMIFHFLDFALANSICNTEILKLIREHQSLTFMICWRFVMKLALVLFSVDCLAKGLWADQDHLLTAQ